MNRYLTSKKKVNDKLVEMSIKSIENLVTFMQEYDMIVISREVLETYTKTMRKKYGEKII